MCAGTAATLSFNGKEAAKNILHGGEGSTFKAEISLSFKTPVSLDGPWQQQLHTAVQGINVSACVL